MIYPLKTQIKHKIGLSFTLDLICLNGSLIRSLQEKGVLRRLFDLATILKLLYFDFK